MRSKSIKSLIPLAFFVIIFGQKSFAELEVKNAWIRTAPPNSEKFSGYLKLKNTSSDEIIINNLKSNAFEKIEIHSSSIENGISLMKKIDGLKVPIHSEFNLEPGNYHLMLMKLSKTLKVGEEIEFMLHFKHSGMVKVIAPVKEGKPMKNDMKHDHD